MGYKEALEAAGAKVLAFEMFGSYQGDWAALVEYKREIGIAFGSFGSCSYCDAFQAEFDSYDEEIYYDVKTGKYYNSWYNDDEKEVSKEEYAELLAKKNKKLSDFGEGYLNNLSDKRMI